MDIKKTAIVFSVTVVALTFVCLTGYWGGYRHGEKALAGQYEAGLAELTNINNQLKDRNIELENLNTELARQLSDVAGKLDEAKKIVGSLDVSISSAGGTVSRLIENLSRLRILVLGTEKKDEAKN